MRITKQIAADVADKMSKPAFDAAEALRTEMRKLVTELRIATTPKEIMEAFAHPKLKPYIRTCNGLKIHGMGLYSEFVGYTQEVLPEVSEYTRTFQLTADTEYIAIAFNKWKNAFKEAKDLKEELSITLQNLKTYARVQQELPEASKYLPAATSTALVVSTSKIREKLAMLPQTAE